MTRTWNVKTNKPKNADKQKEITNKVAEDYDNRYAVQFRAKIYPFLEEERFVLFGYY